MSMATYFVQDCPTCGRQLQIRLKYLGRSVQCQHCEAEFQAFDASNEIPAATSDSGSDLLARVDELLANADQVD